ncbi:MAG: hypothetical protein LH647_04690 [Leptolyngbyaceae cyanobacterium CAN_BIN12]|nr:hypothetical protein [Leptolyngbyaceae cyanobacterium CAN_BIN12]
MNDTVGDRLYRYSKTCGKSATNDKLTAGNRHIKWRRYQDLLMLVTATIATQFRAI